MKERFRRRYRMPNTYFTKKHWSILGDLMGLRDFGIALVKNIKSDFSDRT